jgi:hypothetical protein
LINQPAASPRKRIEDEDEDEFEDDWKRRKER